MSIDVRYGSDVEYHNDKCLLMLDIGVVKQFVNGVSLLQNSSESERTLYWKVGLQ
jgi:hypothetical protein